MISQQDIQTKLNAAVAADRDLQGNSDAALARRAGLRARLTEEAIIHAGGRVGGLSFNGTSNSGR